MADQQRRGEIHFDSTCGHLSDDYGEIPIHKFDYSGGEVQRGRVELAGSQAPVGYTPGKKTPPEATITMYRRHYDEWQARWQNAFPQGDIANVRRKLTMTYSLPNEADYGDPIPLAARTDSMVVLVNPAKGLGADRGQGEAPLMVEVPLFVTDMPKVAGVQQ